MSPTDPDAPEETPSDPALIVSIAELTRRVGTRRPIQVSTKLHAPAVAGIVVPDERSVTGTLTMESVLDGIVVSGTLVAPWRGECRRCLDPLEGTVDIAVRELFEASATPGETYPIDGDHIDLNPLVNDAVLLSLPLTPICRPDCPGPDPERFPTTVVDDAAPPADPRWAALAELRFDD